jgi:hypothetical protein
VTVVDVLYLTFVKNVTSNSTGGLMKENAKHTLIVKMKNMNNGLKKDNNSATNAQKACLTVITVTYLISVIYVMSNITGGLNKVNANL